MKKLNLFAIIPIVALLFLVGSCKKSDSSIDLTQGLTGTYKGNLEINDEKTTNPATAYIEKINDYSITIHCISTDFDTTFMMDLYANGDSTMLCFTDADFQLEYNHHMSSGHHMMNDNNWQSWSNHMSKEHSAGDVHYGSFSMSDHTFTYRFKNPGSDVPVSKVFSGTKIR